MDEQKSVRFPPQRSPPLPLPPSPSSPRGEGPSAHGSTAAVCRPLRSADLPQGLPSSAAAPPPQSCIYIQDLLLVAEICSQRRLLKAKRRLDLLQRFCLVLLSLDLLFFFNVALEYCREKKQIVIARYGLKNGSLTVVFRDAIESCCHIFCLLCCYPIPIHSLHRFLGGNLIAGDPLLFVVIVVIVLGAGKGFGVMFSYSSKVE